MEDRRVEQINTLVERFRQSLKAQHVGARIVYGLAEAKRRREARDRYCQACDPED